MQRLVWAAVLLTALSFPAWAQEPFDNMFCSDYHNARVKIVSDSSARKLSEANMTVGGKSVIRINSGQLNDLSGNVRSFAVNFSCASLVLGHLVKGAENIYDYYENNGIYLDGIINVVFVRIFPKDEKKWGRYFFYNFYELDGGKKFNAWWSSFPEIDWENDTNIEIKKEAASYLYNEIYELRFGSNYIGEVVEILDDDLLKIFLSKTNIHKNIKVELMKYYSVGREGRDEWIADLKYINTFITENKILKEKYIDILNGNSSQLDSLINNYSIIIREDSLLLSGGGSSYWKDGMNDYYGKILSITNDEAIVKVLKQEYPFGRIRVGDEVYIYDDY